MIEMDNPTLERDILAEVMMEPTAIRTLEMQPDWFNELPHQEIAEALSVLVQTQEPNFYDVQEYVKQRNPLSNGAKEDFLLDLFTDVRVHGIEEKLKLLKKRHYERRLHHASTEFSRKPSKHNGERLKNAIEELEKSSLEDGDGDWAEALEEVDYELDHEVDEGIKTYGSIDDILAGGIQPARMVVIGARPAVGKSAFQNNLILRASERQAGIAIDVFSLEMTKKQMLMRLLANLTEINSYRLVMAAKSLNENEKEKVRAKMRYLQTKNIHIYTKQQNIDSIIREIRKRAEGREKGTYIAMIDYLQLVSVTDQSKSRQLQIGEVTRKIKLLAIELEIPIIVLSQLNRGLESRQDKRPTLSDLRESGDIEQDADIVMFLHPDEEEDGVTNVIIDKNRDGQAGVAVPFHFLKQISHFDEAIR